MKYTYQRLWGNINECQICTLKNKKRTDGNLYLTKTKGVFCRNCLNEQELNDVDFAMGLESVKAVSTPVSG